MRKNLLMRFKSIRTSIIVALGVLMVASLLAFLFISLRYTENTVLENSQEYTSQMVGQVNSDIDSYISYMENISEIVAGNADVRRYLFSTTITEENRESVKESVLELFATITETRGDITNIGLLADGLDPILDDGTQELNPYIDVTQLSWYQEAVESPGETAVSSSHVQNAVYDQYDWVVTLSLGISSAADSSVCGVFFVDLNYTSISDLCEGISLGNKGYIYILDEDGTIVYHPQQQLIYSGMKEELISEIIETEESSILTDDGKLYTISKSEATGWTVVGVAYLSEMMSGAAEARFTYVIAAVILFIAALIVAFIISNEITKPIKALEDSMKEVEKGNFDRAALEVRDNNEIGRLTGSFNLMTEEIRKLIEQIEQEQQAKRRYELQVLQNQINPHFLYNTLDSIIWMAEWGRNDEVVTMTSSLALLLRQTISSGREVVTVSEEIDYTEAYLTIQKMRYEDKLEYDISVGDDILEGHMVKLILQPLVENAIYHGIKYKEGKGFIEIRGFRSGDDIVFQVEDDGQGMDEDTLAHIFERHGADAKSSGVGVSNVNERLKLYYGNDYGLSYESSPGAGTTVTVVIPFGEEGEND